MIASEIDRRSVSRISFRATMIRQLLFLFAVLTATAHGHSPNDSGEFIVLYSPDSVEFTVNGNKWIEQSYLKEILSAALGYTGKLREHNIAEHNVVIWDPFSFPQGLVVIAIDEMDTLPFLNDKSKVTYPLIVDEAEETTWQAIRSRVEERSNDNVLVRINLSDGVDALGQSALGELKPANMEKLKSLSSEVDEDRKFVEEMQLLHAIADNASSAKKHDSGTDVYWLVVSALKPLLDLHGNSSAPALEAYTLLNDAFEHVSKAFVNTYSGRIVIAAFTNDARKLRNTRSVHLERQRRDSDPFSNRAKSYSENYPVIFNILLWFGVAFFFSLLAICIAIADMDPGRDSIIYRMTSNRMKKDN